MTNNELTKGLILDVGPPTKKDLKLNANEWISLALQFLWVTILVLNDIVLFMYEAIFPPPGKSLSGQTVVVTGGGRGLGRGLALGFSREGCKVAVVDINIDNARKTAEEINGAGGVAKAYLCNVANSEDIKVLRESVTSDLGPVDILVNNAAIIYGGELLENCQEQDLRVVMEVNLMSHFWMLKEFLPEMKARNKGHVVAIASVGSYFAGETGAAYITSKFGVRGFMEVIHHELGLRPDNNVHTTTVFPYFINTSEDYVNCWEIRLPPVSIDDVVEATINGVRRNSVSVFVPSIFSFLAKLVGWLPPRTVDRYKKLFVLKIDSMQPKREPEMVSPKFLNGLKKD